MPEQTQKEAGMLTLSRRALLQGAAAAPLAARQPVGAQKPNVIVILFDDLGVHDLGYLGANDLRTPNIDRLASSGVVCRNWYSNAPVCAPARSALMTGRNPLRAGVPDNGHALRPTEKDHRFHIEGERIRDCPCREMASRLLG